MIITTRTEEQRIEDMERWKRRFAFFPVKVQDGEWRWLEFYEFREVRVRTEQPCFLPYFWVEQRRAAGSYSSGHPKVDYDDLWMNNPVPKRLPPPPNKKP